MLPYSLLISSQFKKLGAAPWWAQSTADAIVLPFPYSLTIRNGSLLCSSITSIAAAFFFGISRL